MQRIIRIRDVVRSQVHRLGADEPVLRGPYELFQPVGAVKRRGAVVDYLQGHTIRTGRVVDAVLGETHPGERVLVRLEPGDEDEWWLCEVEAIEGEGEAAAQ